MWGYGMSDETHQEYDNEMTDLLEAVWGEGFMSPGGPDEVDRILDGLDLTGTRILDIGCGIGGVNVHVARTYPVDHIVGIDIESGLIERCTDLAEKYGVDDRAVFRHVEPGPLPFEKSSFDLVISKDSIIHITDKHALARDIMRVLKPGGVFAASDWLAGYDDEPTPEMRDYIRAEGLDFGLESATVYRDALTAAGFEDIRLVDRNAWYRTVAREERARLAGTLYDGLSATVGTAFLDHEIDVWDKMTVALDQGQLRPTYLRARKP